MINKVTGSILLAAMICSPVIAGDEFEPVAEAQPYLIGESLYGFDWVTIEGQPGMWDARFMDGSCEELYAPCIDTNGFPFNEAGAVKASEALMREIDDDTVFTDTPSLVNGCDAANCALTTPYEETHYYYGTMRVSEVSSASFLNYGNTYGEDDFVGTWDNGSSTYDSTQEEWAAYVVWTPSPESCSDDPEKPVACETTGCHP